MGLKSAILKFLLIILLLSSAAPVFAVKVQRLPLVSDFYIGIVNGVGFGLNFGFNAGFDLFGLRIGPEVEQLILDVDYSASVNATRYGGYINIPLTRDLHLNLHAGYLNMQVTKANINYIIDGTLYTLDADKKYGGNYQAVSLNYLFGEYKITPKLVYNMIEGQGVFLREFDFNLARSF